MLDLSFRRVLTTAVLCVSLLAAVGCETTTMMREKGVDALRADNLELAEHHFARAAQREPEDYLSQYYLGMVHLRKNENLKAQLALERALTLRPETSEMYTGRILDMLAEAMFRQGRYDSLHTFLERSASYYHGTGDYLRQAKYLVKTGDIDSAKVAFRKAAFFAAKDDPTPYIAIADFYAGLNDVPNAVAALRYAYYVSPTNPEVAAGLRKYGIVPGPTVAVEPPKPELLR